MSWMTRSEAVFLRNALRSTGLTRMLARVVHRPDYESGFHSALSSAVRPGDIVWDIGANIGFYTVRFAEQAGPNGHVYAFEPSTEMFERLGFAIEEHANCTPVRKALGDHNGREMFKQSGTTSHIVTERDDDTIEIEIATGDALIAARQVQPPTVMKIDVEGFELDVLTGLTETLKRPALRFVGVEVHFSELSKRGLNHAPAEIERRLEAAGLQTRWVGSSHIIAERS